ncbi:hypothetical protein [Aquiflexum lacus]|uniref:hypothetical protein n=1 Tax=Aquiflexum lacus TaxID=2483805 RepID=UPI001893E63B|nr:hypothetical protein [Aquiflexum lacus]
MQLVTSFWCIYQKWGFLIQGASEVSSPTLGLSQIHGKFHAFLWLIYLKLSPIMLPVSVEPSELNMDVGELNKHTVKGTYLLNQFNCTAPPPSILNPPLRP